MESAPVYSNPYDSYMRVSATQIGDTVILTKTQVLGKTVKGSITASLLSAKPRLLAVKAEGMIDQRLYGELYTTWVKDTGLCLFRVESPMPTVGEAKERAVVKYGQPILLRHIHSEGLLTLHSLHTGTDPGTWAVLVTVQTSPHLFSKITLAPNNQLQKPGESIKYSDKLHIEFLAEHQQYLLHVSKTDTTFEVNASQVRSTWQLRKYESCTEEEAVRCGIPILLRLGRGRMMVTEGFDKPEPLKITHRLLGLNGKPYETNAKSPTETTSPHLTQSILAGMGDISSLTLVRKMQLTTEETDCGTMWILEKTVPLQGGPLLWEDHFYLKNLKSGHYVTNINLELRPEPDPEFYFLVVRSDSLQSKSYVPANYPIIIKSANDLFLSPEKVVAEEEFMVDIVPTSNVGQGNVNYESKLGLSKDQDAENPLEIEVIPEANSLLYMRVAKLIPKIKEIRSILSNWMSCKDSLAHLAYIEKEKEVNTAGSNLCSSLHTLENRLEQSHLPEIQAKCRCTIAGLGLSTQLIELAALLVDYSVQPHTPEHMEIASFPSIAAYMEQTIWSFLRLLVDNLPFVCELLSSQDRLMMNLLSLRKSLIGPVLTEVYRVLDPEIKDVRAFFKGWVERLSTVTKQNIVEQTVFFQLLKNVCEVEDRPKPEYQRALISLLYQEKRFFLIKLYRENDTFWIHFFTLHETSEEFLQENPELAQYARFSQDGRTIFPLSALFHLPDYINYLQETLSLITVLCKGRVSSGREVAFSVQGLALEAEDIHAILALQGAPVGKMQSFIDLAQATILTIPISESFRELEAENYCFEEEKMVKLGEMEIFQRSLTPPITYEKSLSLLRVSLSFWLSPDLPPALQKFTQKDLLQPILSTLRFTSDLIEYNHTTSLYTRIISVLLAYMLAGFSGKRGRKFMEKHWVVQVIQGAMGVDRGGKEEELEVVELFKQVIGTVDLIQLKMKRYKLNSVVSFFKSHPNCDFSPNSPEMMDLISSLKAYTTRKITEIAEIKQFLSIEDDKSLLTMLATPPRLADYLVYSVLNLSSVTLDLKKTVLHTLKSAFNEELVFFSEVQRVELLQGGSGTRARLVALKEKLEPTEILTKAKAELNEGGELTSLRFVRDMLQELVALLRPSESLSITQNILRNLGLHRTILQLWPLITRLDQAKDMSEADILLTFDFKALLVSFLAYFVHTNPENQTALISILEKKHFTLDFPLYAELIFDLTHFTHIPQLRLEKVISNIVDRCDTFRVPSDLNAYHFLRLIMLSPDRKEIPTMQNIIARYIAEKYRDLPEFCIGKCYRDAVFVELLSRAAMGNSAISVMCRALVPLDRLTELFERENNPAVLSSLLSFLVYVYVWPREDKYVKQLNSYLFLTKIVDKLLTCLNPLFTEESRLISIGKKNNYELVFEEAQWPMVDINIARDPFDEERNIWRLMCHKYPNDQYSGGFLPLVPWLFLHADCPEKLETQAKSAIELVGTLHTFLSTCIEEGMSISCLEEAVIDFKTRTFACFPSLIERDNHVRTKSSGLFSLHRLPTFGVSTISSNPEFPLFLQAFTQAYAPTSKPALFTRTIAQRFLRFTGLKQLQGQIKPEDVETTITYLGRLHRLFTHSSHAQDYFSILTYVVPGNYRVKVGLNRSFMKAGVIDEAVDTVLQPCIQTANAALRFLNKLLEEQDSAFQRYFQSLVDRSERSYYLFYRIKEELDSAKAAIVSTQTPSLTQRDTFLVRSLKFLQLCCDNCNISFQNYIRQQGNQIGKADVDLVSEVAQFLIDVQDKSKEIMGLYGPGKIIIKAIAALLDFVTGPCPENQERLGKNVLLFQAINSFVKVTQMELDEISIGVHNKIMVFLLTLLEGSPQPIVPLTMVRFLDLKLLREGVEKIYREFICHREEDIYRELEAKQHLAKVKSALLQAILLLKLKKHCHHLELKKFASEDSAAYEFYTRNIGYVQVEWAGKIEEVYFSVPFMCKFLTPASRQSLILDINRSSHQSKVEDFLEKVDYYHTEMQHQQHLSQYRGLKSLSKRWKLYAQLSYLMVLLLNILLLATLTETAEKTAEVYPRLTVGLLLLGLLQLLLYVASFIFNMIEYLPLRLQNAVSYEGMEMDGYPYFPDNESYRLYDTVKCIEISNRDTTSFKNSLRDITQNLDFYYNFIYLLVAVLGLYEPLMYPILLLDIIKQNQELVNILKSITVNLRQLLLTLVLGLIVIFLFSVHSFGYFQKYYSAATNADCSTLYTCFTSTLYYGIRAGGGIGDGLDPATTEDYWARMAFDLLYYVVMIIILLNIIFGIIIDTFAQLRDERSEMMKDLSNTCYICGTSRSQIELKGKGWSHHFMCEHSPFAYLAFFVYLHETNVVDCSGVEKYVKEKVEAKDSSFMPTTSKLLQKKLLAS